MENKTSPGNNRMMISALVILIIPMYIQFSWMIIWRSSHFATPDEKTDYYLSLFPSFLQNNTVLSLIAFLLCLTSFILGAICIDKVNEKIRWLAFATVAISFILGLMCLVRIM